MLLFIKLMSNIVQKLHTYLWNMDYKKRKKKRVNTDYILYSL